MANRYTDLGFLCRRMDPLPLHLQPHVKEPLLGPPCVRNGTRRSTLGPDPVEHLEYGPLSAMGGGSGRKCPGGPVLVVVARCARCHTGCR